MSEKPCFSGIKQGGITYLFGSIEVVSRSSVKTIMPIFIKPQKTYWLIKMAGWCLWKSEHTSEWVMTHLRSYFPHKMDGPGISGLGLNVTHPEITVLPSGITIPLNHKDMIRWGVVITKGMPEGATLGTDLIVRCFQLKTLKSNVG